MSGQSIKAGQEVRYVKDPFLYDRVKVEEWYPRKGVALCLVTQDDVAPVYETFFLKLGNPPVCEIEPVAA